MNLIWNGHSCFTLETAEGSVVFDPYRDGSVPGLSPIRLTADLVLCSHDHRDHGARELVGLTGRTPSFSVETISTFHDPEGGALRGPDTIHIVAAEGMRLAHLGDLGCIPTPEQLDRLRGLDVLLIPVGGYYTIDASQAQELVEDLKPRIVVPMHYRSDTFGYEVIARLEDFLALRSDVVRYPGSALELTPHTPTQTAVLTYRF
ncbi:MBL fold metallo-hydrolase [Pseudoflavonifractor phocaeensis]|uniref:MBL fold metallo-hydrolase n=1 Tax=Pseudoflavonifractor phocaeensis TaxID=1870988 RepID=UPI001F2E3B7B|nr:MBL fold metallo-hydrolase [Pseudoflavonifractor phocaeensis]MCF2595158.1 MBL fold metallo-hydrolase [Pseudoflavonifractor phocaeensis]